MTRERPARNRKIATIDARPALLWLLGLLLAALGPAYAQEPLDTQLQLAGRIVAQYMDGDDAALRDYFSPRLIKSTSLEQVASTRAALLQRGGGLRYVQAARRIAIMQDGRLTQAAVPVDLEQFSAEVLLTWNGELRKGSLEGFAVRPVSMPRQRLDVGSITSFVDASYTDRSAFRESRLPIGPDNLPPLDGRLAVPTLAADGRRLPALLILPDREKTGPDGDLGPSKPMRDLAQGLASRGVVTLRFPHRTLADPAFGASVYTAEDAWVSDGRAALRMLEVMPEVDPGRIHVLGMGVGGHFAPMLVSGVKGIQGLILLSPPAVHNPDLYLAQFERDGIVGTTISADDWQRVKGSAVLLKEGRLDAGTFVHDMPARHWYSLRGYDPAAQITAFRGQTLLVFGGRDYLSGPTDYKIWGALDQADPDVTLVYYQDLNRWLMPSRGDGGPGEKSIAGHVDGRVIRLLIDFIAASE